MNRRKKILCGCLLALAGLSALAGSYLFRDPTLVLMLKERFGKPEQLSSSLVEKLEPVEFSQVRLQQAIEHGVQYLIAEQSDGLWQKHPGISALCLAALLQPPQALPSDHPAILRARDELLKLQGENGSFAIAFSLSEQMRNYTTALAVIALSHFEDEGSKLATRRGRDYLVGAQNDEADGYTPDSSEYGGLGYGTGGDGDLSNLQLALEAVRSAGLEPGHPFYEKALAFVSRCQDGEGNDRGWAQGGGGFVYTPVGLDKSGDEKQPDPYGAMSFAGLKSLLFCELSPDDPRVLEVQGWISRNFKVDEHPGRGQASVFYYHLNVAKALDAAGQETLELASGGNVRWKESLGMELLARQREDGSWINPERKYMEGLPVLASAYALQALKICAKTGDESAE